MIDDVTGLPKIPTEIIKHGDTRGFFWRINVSGMSGYLELQLRYKPFWWTPSALVRKSGPYNTSQRSVLVEAAQAIIAAEVQYVQRQKLAGDYPPLRLGD